MPFFTVVERERSVADKILDYSISQTTLEEVFLNVRTCCMNKSGCTCIIILVRATLFFCKVGSHVCIYTTLCVSPSPR